MSTSVAPYLAGLLQLVAPITGYMWALRTGKSRGQIVLASAFGGSIAGVVFVIPMLRAMGPDGSSYYLFNAILSSTVMGACIGLAGLVARGIGAWLSRRP